MDGNPSSSASRTVNHRIPRPGDREKLEDRNKVVVLPPSHRPYTYKEKFQALREKYDQVNAINEEYQRDLAIATSRIKKIEAENDLLLDAISLAATQQPTLFPPSVTSTTEYSPHPSHMNGNSNGNTNGTSRHRPIEPHGGPPVEFVAHDINGRVP